MTDFNLFWFAMLQVGNYLDYYTTKRFPHGVDMEGNPSLVFYSKIRSIPWGKTVKEYKIGVAIFLTFVALTGYLLIPLLAGCFFGVAVYNETLVKYTRTLSFYSWKKNLERQYFDKTDDLGIITLVSSSLLFYITWGFVSVDISMFIGGICLIYTVTTMAMLIGIAYNKITYLRNASWKLNQT